LKIRTLCADGLALTSMVWLAAAVPHQQRWNSKAITATLVTIEHEAELEGWYLDELEARSSSTRPCHPLPPPIDGSTRIGSMWVGLTYDLQNTSNTDYVLATPQSADIVTMEELRGKHALVLTQALVWGPKRPLIDWVGSARILIPAHETVRVVFETDHEIFDADFPCFVQTEWTSSNQRKFVEQVLSRVKKFVLFDKVHRYRIALPVPDFTIDDLFPLQIGRLPIG
jgi:hypothetical protein